MSDDLKPLKSVKSYCDDLEAKCVKIRAQLSSIEGNRKKNIMLRKSIKRRYALEFLEEYGKPREIHEDIWNDYPSLEKWRILIKHDHDLDDDRADPDIRRFLQSIGEKDAEKQLSIVERVLDIIYEDMDNHFKDKKPAERDDLVIESVLDYLERLRCVP